jgi:hypothetical protein
MLFVGSSVYLVDGGASRYLCTAIGIADTYPDFQLGCLQSINTNPSDHVDSSTI